MLIFTIKLMLALGGSKTPFASIRRIVQTNKEFYKVRAGLWGLCDFRDKNLAKTGDSKSEQNEKFIHSYFQGVIVEIGNLRHFQTFIPAQDKNKIYKSDKKLCELKRETINLVAVLAATLNFTSI